MNPTFGGTRRGPPISFHSLVFNSRSSSLRLGRVNLMKRSFADILICTRCLPRETPLKCKIHEASGDHILEGSLQCPRCRSVFPIEEGIADLSPETRGRGEGTGKLARYETRDLLVTYLWSHYSDLWGDEEANSAYQKWAGLMNTTIGFSLDVGCAVGRFAFELTQKSDFVVGMDLSRSFIRAARALALERRLTFQLPQEGLLVTEKHFTVPESWRCDRVEFIVGDAQAVPFPMGLFSTAASLNLLDKVPSPMRHLEELNRIARRSGGQLLVSDPFSWSEEVSEMDEWLGGKRQGDFAGRGIDNLISCLRGEKCLSLLPWTVEGQGSMWWKIRNHENHFELIRSLWVKAGR
jgi:SAM-dependent methyltransferase